MIALFGDLARHVRVANAVVERELNFRLLQVRDHRQTKSSRSWDSRVAGLGFLKDDMTLAPINVRVRLIRVTMAEPGVKPCRN